MSVSPVLPGDIPFILWEEVPKEVATGGHDHLGGIVEETNQGTAIDYISVANEETVAYKQEKVLDRLGQTKSTEYYEKTLTGMMHRNIGYR